MKHFNLFIISFICAFVPFTMVALTLGGLFMFGKFMFMG